MARGLHAAVCLLLALAGAQGATTSTINGRLFGPLDGTSCTVSVGSSPSLATGSTTMGTGVSLNANQFVVIQKSSCTDQFTGVNIPFPLVGYAVTSAQAVVPVDATTSIGTTDQTSTARTAQTSYTQLGISSTDVATTAWATGLQWEYNSPFDILKLSANNYPITTAKKLLVKDLQFLIVVQGILQAGFASFPNNCADALAVYNAVATAVDKSGLTDMTDSTALTTLFTTVIDTTCGKTAGSGQTAATASVAGIIQMTKLAATLASQSDNSWPLQHLGSMARLAGYASLGTTTGVSNAAGPASGMDVQALTSTPPTDASLRSTIDANALDVSTQWLALATAVGISPANIAITNTATTINAYAAGPATTVSGAKLLFQSVYDLALEATGYTTTAGVTSAGSPATTSHGLWSIPSGTQDDFLTPTAAVNPTTTLVPITGVVPFPDAAASPLTPGASSSTADSIFVTPINAYVFAQFRLSQGDSHAIAAPTKDAFTTAYQAITGVTTLPTGDYLRRSSFAAGTVFTGSYLHLALYASDILLSNTVSLGATFIGNAGNAAPSDVQLDPIVRNIFLSMAGMSGTVSTSLSTASSVQTMLTFAYQAQKGKALTADETAALAAVSTAIANANTLVKNILNTVAVPKVATWYSSSDATTVPAAEHWLQLARIAKAVNTMGSVVSKRGAEFQTAGTANKMAFVQQALLDTVQSAFTGSALLNAVSDAVINPAAVLKAITPPSAVVASPFIATFSDGYTRFFGPLDAGCKVTLSTTGTRATYLGHATSPLKSATETVTIDTSCTDMFTGLPVPYPVFGQTSGSTTAYQVSSTTTATTTTAAHAYSQLASGISGSDFTSQKWETTSLWDELINGNILNAKFVMKTDVQYIALSLGVAKAFLAISGLPSACNSIPKVQAELGAFIAGTTLPDMTDATVGGGIITAIRGVGAACAAAASLTKIDTTAAEAFAPNIANLTTLASTLASTGTNNWPLNDISALVHLVAYMSSSSFDLGSADLLSQTALKTAISPIVIKHEAVAGALALPYQVKDTKVVVNSAGPLSGVQLTYQPFHMLSGSPLVDASSKPLTTDGYGAVINPSATHGLYTVPAGAVDMVLSTGPSDQVQNLVPYTGMVNFPHSPGLTATDTVYLSMGSALAYEQFKAMQAIATAGTTVKISTSVDHQGVYAQFAGSSSSMPINAPVGDYVARTLVDATHDNVFQGSNMALSMFCTDIMISNYVTLATLWINNVLPASSNKTNTPDQVAQNLVAQLAGSTLSTMKQRGDLVTEATVNTMITAALNTAYGDAKGAAFSLPSSSSVTDAVTMIATTIANVNAPVNTALATAAGATKLTDKSSAASWITAAQVAKLVNTNLANAVIKAAQSYRAGLSGTSNTQVNTQNQMDVQTTFTGSNTTNNNLTDHTIVQVLNLTALALITGPMQGYARFYGPVSAGCNVNFTTTLVPQVQWTRTADSYYPGQVIGIEYEQMYVGWTDTSSSYPCMDTITGQVIPYPISGRANAVAGSHASFFQLSSSATVATHTSTKTVAEAYTKLGVTTSSPSGVDSGDWTSNGMWETSDLWANFKNGNLRVSKILLSTDLQFMALSLAASKAILAAGEAASNSGCNTTATLQDALASWAANNGLDMATYNGVKAALTGIQSICGSNWNKNTSTVTTGTNINAILALTQLAAKLSGTAASSTSWHLKDAAAMARFVSYLQTADLSAAGISNDTLRAAVGKASIVPTVLASTLGVTYTTKDTFVQAASLGPVGAGVTLTYQPFHWLDAASLSTQTDNQGSVSVTNATHGTYTIPAGAVDTFLTTDPASPVKTLVDITAITGWTPESNRIIVNPAGALVYAYYRNQVAVEGNAVSVPSAAHWAAVYNQLLPTNITLPPKMDYQSRADEAYLGSQASLCVLASDVILQSVPVLGGVFISKSTTNDTSSVVPQLFDGIVGLTAAQLSDATVVSGVIANVYANVIAKPSNATLSIINSVAAGIASSNAQANSILVAAAANMTTATGQQNITNWLQLAKIAKVQMTALAGAISTVGQSLLSAGTSLTSVQTAADANVNVAFNATNFAALVALQSVNEVALRNAAGLSRQGVARFFGPVSAGCPVAYRTSQTTSTTMLGEVSATISEQVVISTAPACVDTFTGLPIPYAATGYAVDQFQVSATTSIGAYHGSTPKTAEFSYDQLGATVNISAPLWSRDIMLESADIFSVFAQGNITLAKTLLTADLQFMALSAGIIQAIISSDTSSSLVNGCNTPSSLQAALATYVASLADASPPSTLSIQTVSDVTAAIAGVGAQCSSASAAIPSSVLTGAQSNAAAILSLVQVAASLTNDIDSDWPLRQLGVMAHFVSYISGSFKFSDASSSKALTAAIAATPVSGAGITAALDISGYNAADTPVIMAYAGPCKNVNVTYAGFTDLVEKSLADGADFLVHVSQATHGIYTLAANATMTFLTVDDNNPVKTRTPITAVTSFVPGSGNLTVGPIGSIVHWGWHQGEGINVSVPMPTQFQQTYEMLTGFALPPNDYHARNYTLGSATALAIFVVDMWLPGAPTLGSILLVAMCPANGLATTSSRLYAGYHGVSMPSMTANGTAFGMLTSAYNDLCGVPHNATALTGRRLLQTDPRLIKILTAVAYIISDTTSMANDLLTTAQAAIVNNTAVSNDLFYQAAQIAAVQNGPAADAIQQIANLVATGQLDAAVTAAQTAQTAYTGANLRAAVAAAQINTAAIDSSQTAPVVDTSSSDSSDKSLAIGLGVGLGVGIPVVGLAAAAIVMTVRKRRAMQSTTPAPPA